MKAVLACKIVARVWCVKAEYVRAITAILLVGLGVIVLPAILIVRVMLDVAIVL